MQTKYPLVGKDYPTREEGTKVRVIFFSDISVIIFSDIFKRVRENDMYCYERYNIMRNRREMKVHRIKIVTIKGFNRERWPENGEGGRMSGKRIVGDSG